MSLRQVWSTWWPLAASWLMMGFELPAVSATMARLADPEISLAAYGGVVFPISLLIEAPIIMLLSASTVLARDRESYRKLRRFMMSAGGALTALHLAIAATPLFDVIVAGVIGAPEEIRPAARMGLLIMTPWTWSIAYRRFQQGVLIRFGRSRVIGVGTALRLVTNVTVLVLGFLRGDVPGIVVGTSAVVAGVVAEAIFVRIAVRPVLANELPAGRPGHDALTPRRFAAFYTPLALTSVLALLSLPMGSAAMSRLPRPIESLAVWPVINGLVFTLRSLGFAFHEVVMALLDREGAYRALRRFTGILAAATTLLLLAVAATPLSRVWFADVSALAPPLAGMGMAAIWIAFPLPALSVAQHWFQGILTAAHRTRAVGEAMAIALAVTGAALIAGVRDGSVTGIYVGLFAVALGHSAQSAWLAWRSRGIRKGLRAPGDAPVGPAARGLV